MIIKLKIIEETFSVCKVRDYSEIDLQAAFVFVGSTDEEKSLVCPTRLVPANTTEREDGWLAKGGTWSDDSVSVWALGSTDSGVSWIVETEGKAASKREQSQACLDSAEREQARPKVKRIFHAGDLNNWYAKFLSDDNPDQLRYSFENLLKSECNFFLSIYV